MSTHKMRGEGRRILVVDDDLAIRVLLQAVFKRLGFKVELAEDGEAGLRILKDQTFDLVLLDLMMPKVSGYEFLERVRNEHNAPPHIVVFTAAGQRGIARIPEESVCGTILKPFDLETFLALVQRCLDGHETRASGS